MTDNTKGTELARVGMGSVQVADVQSVRVLAKDLLDSGLFPGVRGVAGAVTIIQAGIELGIPPVAALNTMAIVNGRLAMEAKLLLAVAHNRAGVTWTVLAESKEGCKIKFSRPGWPDAEASFTVAEAKAANLLGKTNWQLYEKDMYFARASSRGVRRIAPDAILGLYAKEEIEDAPASLNGSADVPLAPVAIDPGLVAEVKAKAAAAKAPASPVAQKPLPHVKDEFTFELDAMPAAVPNPDIDLVADAEVAAEAETGFALTPEDAEPTDGGGPDGPTMQQLKSFAKRKSALAAYGIPEQTLWTGIHRFTSKTFNRCVTELSEFTTGEMDKVLGYLARWEHAQQKDEKNEKR